MCGIAGICAFGGWLEGAEIERAARRLRHRGPDDEGFVVYDAASRHAISYHGDDSVEKRGSHIRSVSASPRTLAFAHRRLAILDPTPAGHQPMSDPEGKLWVVHNGEIYNFRELRRELESLGVRFTTQTDTEVLLASYRTWGSDCLRRFNGMWSFAILDCNRQLVFAARDRVGVKPFYYALNRDGFAFASEVRPLLELPFVKTRANLARVYDYLMWGSLRRSTETFYDAIAELPPAHWLAFDLRTLTVDVQRYYTLQANHDLGEFDDTRFREHVGTIRDLIFGSVRRRLVADVPVGSCLSGGVDSSSIVGCISALLKEGGLPAVGERQRVYTACFSDPTVDESRYAEAVVARTGSTWFRTFPTAREFWTDLDAVVRAQGEPFNGPNIYAQYRVMQLARESGVKVLLDGQGGDEVFAGYESFYSAWLLELVKWGRLGTLLHEWRRLGNSPVGPAELAGGVLATIGLNVIPAPLRSRAARWIRGRGRYLQRDFVDTYRHRDEALVDRAVTSVNALSYQLITDYTLPLLLKWEDGNSMAWGIEARTPFADDHPLTEYALSIPAMHKIRNGWSKALLREAMTDILPPTIARRTDKIGFATPERVWLHELAGDAREMLGQWNECVDTQALSGSFDRGARTVSNEAARDTWRLLIFLRWRDVVGGWQGA